jgi:hypothetical protein
MGWHCDLELTCVLRPEFIEFFEKEFLRKGYSYRVMESDDLPSCIEMVEDAAFTEEYSSLSKAYRDAIDIWLSLQIGPYFYKYDLSGAQFTCRISKKCTRHEGNLWDDYETFVKEVIVPASSEILLCKLSEDDYGNRRREYTDLELRGGRLVLRDIIRSVEHVWEEGAIAETRVVYRRGILANQRRDLERALCSW